MVEEFVNGTSSATESENLQMLVETLDDELENGGVQNCEVNMMCKIIVNDFVVHLCSSIKTFIHAFAFGFGIHLLMYMVYINKTAAADDLKTRMKTSMIFGFATGCVAFGLFTIANWFF